LNNIIIVQCFNFLNYLYILLAAIILKRVVVIAGFHYKGVKIVTDKGDRLVQAAATNDLVEAHLLKGLLEGAGIQVFLFDEQAAGYTPFVIGGVRLMVPASELARAREVLQDK
jgi:hypothetical protein